jgi:hypothetical protein
MAIGPMKPDGVEKGPPAPPSQWINNIRDAVRKNTAQQSTRDNYYRNPGAFGGDPREVDPRLNIGAPPPRRQPYVPPSAYERWQMERQEETKQKRRQVMLREFSDDTITSLDELLMPQFGLPANPEGAFKQAFELDVPSDDPAFKLTPEQQDMAEKTRLETRENLGQRQNLINEVEKLQSEDSALPAEEQQLLVQLRRQLLFEQPGKFNELDPLVVTIKNLGTRSQFRKQLLDWKSGKDGATSSVLPWGLDMDATGEDIDAAGGLGGFLQETTGKSSDFDQSPKQFGYLIHTDADGVDHIIKAEEWINLKIADLMPAPTDSREELDRKGAEAADLISTLAFADKYNSFAKKRDAGYRVQLDAAGNPIRAYIHNDDRVALTNLIKDVMAMQEAGYIGPVEEFMKAYADERRGISEVATGTDGVGGSDRDGGGGYRGGGYGYGGGYSSGGGGGGGITLEDPELLKMSVDSIARARMGRSLTNEEAMEFIKHYHSLQAAFVNARMMGADATSLDPEAQAVAWIESRMAKESAGQQAGNFVAALADAMRSGRFSAS